jgi:hypothetical protein
MKKHYGGNQQPVNAAGASMLDAASVVSVRHFFPLLPPTLATPKPITQQQLN